ncbi:penicillin-binding transpeptidase domain-containing protein [Paratissierella segnis]|uniref:Penicillin-binding protein n=1 Tax=Paratissierella segnis TaxID=2763679 RepID=A0A926IKT4_9FIRM|nr:penicillin-binding transpeptidase domain-containing protein [Paratissierella segnis]MBC8588841.1 penicillin-binding protein [Paratissierella segnis]
MEPLKKILNRYNIISFVVVFLMLILTFRLATLTIAQGDEFRYMADNKRLKEVNTTAPRGEIRDRYGRLIAGNKPVFTVQLLKDELNIIDKKAKNLSFLTLIRLLEEDGVDYVDEYPLQLNVFKYKSMDDNINEDSNPNEKVVDLIIDNNLLPEILSTYYINGDYSDHYQFITANRAINALKSKNINVPIVTYIDNDGLHLYFDDSINISNWKKEHEISDNSSPLGMLIELISNDKTIIRKIMDHPLSRLLIFELIENRALEDDITLEEYSISYEDEYLKQKLSLMRDFPDVTLTSTAKDDFVNIFKEVSLKNFLERIIKNEDDSKDKSIIPGKILMDILKEKGVATSVDIEIVDDNNTVIYKYIGGTDTPKGDPLDTLIEQASKSDVLYEFLSSDTIKSLAQEQLLYDGINPKISISEDFEYVAMNNLKNWYSANNIEEGMSVEEGFQKVRGKYGIDKFLSKYEARAILVIYDQLNKQGHLAYQPINIAYDIKESTVAKIEEGLMEYPGINISIEPVRYYPEGTTAAHILGYLGKISQPEEIQKYVEQNKYSPNAIIGKTGVEEYFEDILKGESGVKKVEVDVVGNTTKVIEEKRPVPGNNLYLSIDLKLQEVAEKSLQQTLDKLSTGGIYESQWGNYQFGTHKRKRRPYINATSGAVVAIDVKTGQVLAMASSNPYDPNLFATGISSTDWDSLFPEDESNPLAPRPLLNIATQTAIQPGSTFKMVTGLSALEKGLDPNKKIRDMGKVTIGTKDFNCLIYTSSGGTHGYENLYEALRDSCNYYFYSLAMGKNQKTGESIGVKLEIEDIVEMSKKLGLNDKTGIEINIPREQSGGVPNPQKKIINTKYLLSRSLEKDLHKYLKPGIDMDENRTEEIIDEILGWLELETPLTRNEVIRRLDKMGFDPEKRLPGERSGLADKIKFDYINQAGWNITDTLNVTIGQGQNAYTPIQMANYVATIANGGYRNKLTLVDNIKNYNNTKTLYKHEIDQERIELNNYENLEHIKKGMGMVSSDGSARRVFEKFPIKVATKTGTAERSGINPSTGDTFDDFAWFVGFAPFDEPEIAVAAVIFQGGSGGYAGPMVRDIIAEYLGLNGLKSRETLPYENVLQN